MDKSGEDTTLVGDPRKHALLATSGDHTVTDSWLRFSNLRRGRDRLAARTDHVCAGSPGCAGAQDSLKHSSGRDLVHFFWNPLQAGVPRRRGKRLGRCRGVLPLPALHSLPDVLPTTAVEPAQLCDFELEHCWAKFPARIFRTDDVPDTFGSPSNAVQASAHRHILSRWLASWIVSTLQCLGRGRHQTDSRIFSMAARLSMLI